MSNQAPCSSTAKRRVKYFSKIAKIPQLSAEERERLATVTDLYAFRVNDYYLGLINWEDPDDPIRRLVIPQERELTDWGQLDASNEGAVTVAKAVQHKYASTVLLLVTEVCASYCRYCFRKRLFMHDNAEAIHDTTAIAEGIRYIRDNPQVNNVLLTGGDPTTLMTDQLEPILKALRRIDHVKIVRIGTKTPAFNPYRFIDDQAFLEMLSRYSQPDRRIYFMCHFDHPNELTEASRQALHLIQQAGVICVNQNPIIRRISDNPATMSQLWNELSYIGVPQYYVFQGRPTAGNEPFEVPIVEAYFKVEEAKRRCSGLAKRAKYCMSHESGKIEIIGVDRQHIYLKYHRAKHKRDEQRLLVCRRDDEAFWLDQLQPARGFRNDYYQGIAESPRYEFAVDDDFHANYRGMEFEL